MEALRYIKKIESDTLVLNNLGQFSGQDVEIIILPSIENYEQNKKSQKKDLMGSLSKYASIDKRKEEKSAWDENSRSKHNVR